MATIGDTFKAEFEKANGVAFRGDQLPELAKNFKGHKGPCNYCAGGIVKMTRSAKTMLLEPYNMSCLLCGQPYFYTDKELSVVELGALDMKFWEEKADCLD